MTQSTAEVDELLTSHMRARKTIITAVTTIKNNNDHVIKELELTHAVNEKVILEHDRFRNDLQGKLDSMMANNVQSHSGTKSPNPHGVSKQSMSSHNTPTQGNEETISLERQNTSIVAENSKTQSELQKASKEKNNVEAQIDVLNQKIIDLKSSFKTMNTDSINKMTKNCEKLAVVKGRLSRVQTDFAQESDDVNKFDALLKIPPHATPNAQEVAKHEALSPFDVRPTAFMVGGQENRDSNNGFHELSARIANLARQINRVTAV